MNKVKVLLVSLFTTFSLTAGASAQDEDCDGIGAPQQEASLKAVYYANGTLPAAPTAAEIDALQQLKDGHQQRMDFLQKAFGDNETLQVFAVRDRDGDGITDFRISKCGLFRENDPDVDCDGIANILDNQPFDSVAAPGSQSCAAEPDWHKIGQDQNANNLPDKIDWRLTAATATEKEAADVQERLFKDFKIVLVNRQKLIPPSGAIELDHIIREIFRGQIPPDFPPLRVIAADDSMCGGEWASATPENFTVSIVPETFTDLTAALRLQILAHELSHTLQYSMDFSPEDLRGFRTQNRYDSDGFHAYAETLGWEIAPTSAQPPDLWPVVDNCESFYPVTLTYEGRSPTQWTDDWNAFTAEKRREQKMVGKYAGTDPFEWDAEYKAAFVLNSLFDRAATLCTPAQVDELRTLVSADMTTHVFDYANDNARGLEAYETIIAPQFKDVDADTWTMLTKFFLLSSYPTVCPQ